jgi:hypothetical protein
MLTINDCIGLSNLESDEVQEIASHERLPFIAALEKGAMLTNEPWGDAALRQMVWDNLCHANHHHQAERARQLVVLFQTTCDRHPSPCDRRHSPVRPVPPIWPH